jgi:hypothetical protein
MSNIKTYNGTILTYRDWWNRPHIIILVNLIFIVTILSCTASTFSFASFCCLTALKGSKLFCTCQCDKST